MKVEMMKKFTANILIAVMIFGIFTSFGTSVFAADPSTDDILFYQERDQEYAIETSNTPDDEAAENDDGSTEDDVLQITIQWTIRSVMITEKRNKVWDPENLRWIDSSHSYTNDSSTQGAEIKVINNSSLPVKASVVFAKNQNLSFDPSIHYTVNGETNASSTVDATIEGAKTETITSNLALLSSEECEACAQMGEKGSFGSYTVSIIQLENEIEK